MARIPLFNTRLANSGHRHTTTYALVDDADFEFLSQWNWQPSSRGRQKMKGYAIRKGDNVPMHRLILGLSKDDPMTVDHINRRRLDNRRGNLRLATVAENCQNVPGHKRTSRYRGVSWSSVRQLWVAAFMLNGRHRHVGRFSSEREAAYAVAVARKTHMPFTVETVHDTPSKVRRQSSPLTKRSVNTRP